MKTAINVVATTCLGLAAATVGAAPPQDDALVQSAIAAEVRTSDPAAIQSWLEGAMRRLADTMRLDPDRQIGGVIVFARGLDSKETADFAEFYKLAVLRAEAKVAISATHVTETMSFGAQSLFFLDDPLAERLEKLIGHQRGVFMAMAHSMEASEPSQAAGFREAAYSRDIRFYKVEVVGPASSFDRIERSGEAAAVFIDGSQARVEQLAVEQANVERRRASGRIVIKGRPFEQGPPPGVVISPSAQLGNQPFAPPDPVLQQPRVTPQPAP
jgi:hypothetical protein